MIKIILWSLITFVFSGVLFKPSNYCDICEGAVITITIIVLKNKCEFNLQLNSIMKARTHSTLHFCPLWLLWTFEFRGRSFSSCHRHILFSRWEYCCSNYPAVVFSWGGSSSLVFGTHRNLWDLGHWVCDRNFLMVGQTWNLSLET